MAELELPALAALAVAVTVTLLLFAYRATIGQLFALLVQLLEKATVSVLGVSFNPFQILIDGLNWLNSEMNNALVASIKASEAVWHAIVWSNAYAWQEVSGAVGDLADGTLAALHVLRRSVIPATLAGLFGPLAALVYQLRHNIGALATHVAGLPHTIVKVVESAPTIVKPVDIQRITKVVRAGAVAVPEAFPNPWPRIRDLTREFDELWNGTKRFAGTLTVAGIIGLVGATIFKHFDLGWLRCKGVGRVGKGLCGLSGLIETLFSDALEALVVADLCQFSEALAYAARRFEPVLIEFVNVENALIGCGGNTLPPVLKVAPLSLPPVTGYTLA